MGADIQIEREGTRERGRYVARLAGRDGEAELTFRQAAPGIVVANHTYAPPHLRGSGIAPALVARLVADASAEGFRIRPACSYVRAEFDRHPDWAALLAD